MEKIIITPDVIKDFLIDEIDPTLTVCRNGFAFNNSAAKILALKEKSNFVIEVEDNKFFYKDVTKEGFQISKVGNPGHMKAPSYKANFYFSKLLKLENKSITFKIGEFKEGRRELKLIA